MATIVVLGGGGMAGHMIRVVLSELGHTVYSIGRTPSHEWTHLNVENENALIDYFIEKKPHFVVNCIGILIDESKDDPEKAILINALLPKKLSRVGRSLGFKLLHISSDCVFTGKDGPYSEESYRDADDIYGRTKALGEINNTIDLTIRTSIIGPEIKKYGTGLFHWFMSQTKDVKGYSRTLWSGVTTLELARTVDYCITHNTVGLVHLTNGIPVSKYKLLSEIKKQWKRNDITIFRDNKNISDRSLISIRKDFNYTVPTYSKMLEELRFFMEQHQNIYEQYAKYFNRY